MVPADEVYGFVLAEQLFQGAEARIYRANFYGLPAICKHRFSKQYRHVKLDKKLCEQRTLREARALARCRKHGIRCPTVYAVNRRECTIIMESIQGQPLRVVLDDELRKASRADEGDKEEEDKEDKEKEKSSVRATPYALQLLRGVGEVVGLLHNADVIHGDLTTGNFLVEEDVGGGGDGALGDASLAFSSLGSPFGLALALAGEGSAQRPTAPPGARRSLVVIDFGLVSDKTSAEERAVDLYVLERAVVSAHPFLQHAASKVILEGYASVVEPKKGKATLERLEVVRSRGRKRSMIG